MNSKGIILAFVLTLCGFQSALADNPKPATMADVAWLAGIWQGEMGEGLTEEHWSQPSGDSMMCMFRFIKAGQPVFYEFLTLERREQGLVLHLRHFHPKLVAWEEKDAPLLFAITKATANEVVFERIDSIAVKVKITYKLVAPDRLTSILERVKDGKESRDVFEFRRAAPK
jgi:hypothetical protein